VKASGVVSFATNLNSELNSTARKQQAALPRKTQIQDHGSIQFLIRGHSEITSTLKGRLFSLPSGSSMEISVYNDGPYAGHRATLQPFIVTDTVLCLVGGIGITNALGFVQEYMSENLQRGESSGKSRGSMMKAKQFALAWSAREMALIDHVKENFLVQKDDVVGIEYLFWCTGRSNSAGPNSESIINKRQKARKIKSKNNRSTSGRENGHWYCDKDPIWNQVTKLQLCYVVLVVWPMRLRDRL
jgi:hypothetical protein